MDSFFFKSYPHLWELIVMRRPQIVVWAVPKLCRVQHPSVKQDTHAHTCTHTRTHAETRVHVHRPGNTQIYTKTTSSILFMWTLIQSFFLTRKMCPSILPSTHMTDQSCPQEKSQIQNIGILPYLV